MTAPTQCPERLEQSVSCLALEQANFEQLQRYNLPAVLLLDIDGSERAVLLSALTDGQATLLIDNKPVQVEVDALEKQWRGSALLLAAAPLDTLPLQPGASSELVPWLNERLARLDGAELPRWQGEPIVGAADDSGAVGKQAWLARQFLALQPLVVETRFDTALQQRVQQFQRDQGLAGDGLVDLDTALVLSRLTDHDQPRLSADVVRRGG